MKKSSIRTLLRYPGGKSRAVSAIQGYFPPNLPELLSPFVGGGSIELAMSDQGTQVMAFDAFSPLVAFWQHALTSPKRMAEKVRDSYLPLERSAFYELQKSFSTVEDSFDRAVRFFVLNRASYSGVSLSGGMSPGHPRLTPSVVARLEGFKAPNLEVKKADFADSLALHPNTFAYLDPPYLLGSPCLYGEQGNMHKGFDHERLARILCKRKGWVLSYNDCEAVRKLYRGHKIIELKWVYGMSKSKKSSEILIICDA